MAYKVIIHKRVTKLCSPGEWTTQHTVKTPRLFVQVLTGQNPQFTTTDDKDVGATRARKPPNRIDTPPWHARTSVGG